MFKYVTALGLLLKQTHIQIYAFWSLSNHILVYSITSEVPSNVPSGTHFTGDEYLPHGSHQY